MKKKKIQTTETEIRHDIRNNVWILRTHNRHKLLEFTAVSYGDEWKLRSFYPKPPL